MIVAVVSAVRSHNVARVSKGYESYGDRFAATVIEDLTTSELSQAVKGSCQLSSLLFLCPGPGIEYTLDVDAIIHVASLLAHSASPQVVLDVRFLHT